MKKSKMEILSAVVPPRSEYFGYTDMADELDCKRDSVTSGSIKTSRVVLDDLTAKKWGKPKGTYVTVETDVVNEDNKPDFDRLSKALSEALGSVGSLEDCLVVGLGNPYLTADALGTKVAKGLFVTRHLVQRGSHKGGAHILEHPTQGAGIGCLSVLCPSVLGITGIESADVIKGTVDRIKPKSVLVVDSLASASLSRIACAFQANNAGITPGSGIGNHRMTLSQETLGVPVCSIGVPLVVYATTILEEYAKSSKDTSEIAHMVVTPKDIDLLVEDCAKIIATAINLAVHKNMTADDLRLVCGG